MNKNRCCCILLIACLLSAAAKSETASDRPTTLRPSTLDSPEAVAVPRPPELPLTGAPPPIEEPSGNVGLTEALVLALMQNPGIASSAYEVRAREAAALQASLRPNPELELELENFAGSGELNGFDGSETTLSLGQLVELGDKRMKRRRLAAAERDLAAWDYEVTRIELLSAVAGAFFEVLAAQRAVQLAQEVTALAERVVGAVGARVKAGRVSPLEETRARVELSRARVELVRAERDLESARSRLAATWGGTDPKFKQALGDLDHIQPLPSLEALSGRVARNPELARWATELARRQARLDLERAKPIPDITVRAGVRHLNDSDDTAAVAALSVPLPIFDKNPGGIQEAEWRTAQAVRDRQRAEVRVRAALTQAYQDLSKSHAEVNALRAELLPSAELAFAAAEIAYREGKVGSLDLLDAQRTLFGARRQTVDALAGYHRAVVAVERLIGGALHGEHTNSQFDIKR